MRKLHFHIVNISKDHPRRKKKKMRRKLPRNYNSLVTLDRYNYLAVTIILFLKLLRIN